MTAPTEAPPPSELDLSVTRCGLARAAAGLLVFFAVAFGVPVYEAFQGNWLGKDPGAIEMAEIRTGDFAGRIADEYAKRSVLAETVRPLYNEGLYLAFERTAPQVTVGREGWLFDSMSLTRFRRDDTPEVIERFSDLLARLSKSLEKRGTKLLFMPIPVKATIYPDMLRQSVPRDEVWRPLVSALESRGVWVHDVAPSFDKDAHGLIFNPNNSHWTHETSCRTAVATAEMIRAAYGDEGVPGNEVTGRVREGRKHPLLGDLGKLLGFREGSAAYNKVLYPYQFIDGVDEKGQRLHNFEAGQDLVLVGSSFSYSYQFGPILSATLKRKVEDLSAAGLGGIGAMSRLFDGIGSGGRDLPRCIVWEFPEKYLLYETDDVFQYLGDLNRSMENLSYLGWDATPLEYEVKSSNDLSYEIDERNLIGKPDGYDPYLMVKVKNPIIVDGSWAIAYRVQAEKPTTTKILFDFGGGLKRLEGCVSSVAGRNRMAQVVIRMPDLPEFTGKSIVGFRIDPVDTKTDFVLRDLAILRKP